MAPQRIEQNAMCINVEDSSIKEISHDKDDIIKDVIIG